MKRVTEGNAIPRAYRAYLNAGRAAQDGKAFRHEEFFTEDGQCKPKWSILSIDGGGIRGTIPAAMLAQLEWLLRQEIVFWKREAEQLVAISAVPTANGSHQPYLDTFGRRQFLEKIPRKALEWLVKEFNPESLQLTDVFDLMAGTSTGALIVGMLARPDQDKPESSKQTKAEFNATGRAEQVLGLYLDEGRAIFNPKSRIQRWAYWVCWGHADMIRFEGFDGVDLREKLEKEVPYEINETKVDCLVTMYDFDRNCPMLISTKDKASNSKFASEIGMKDICRASAAAPTLFRPAKLQLHHGAESNFIDGAFVANNPIQHALQWAASRESTTVTKGLLEKVTPERSLALSLGTGESFLPPKPSHFWLTTPKDIGKWGAAGWAKPAIMAAMDGNAKAADQAAAAVFAAAELMPAYLRLQPSFAENGLLDVRDAENVPRLVQAADNYLRSDRLRDMMISSTIRSSEVLQFEEEVRRSFQGASKDVEAAIKLRDAALEQTNAERLIDFAVLLIKNCIVRKGAAIQHGQEIEERKKQIDDQHALGKLMSKSKKLAAEGLVYVNKYWSRIQEDPDMRQSVQQALAIVEGLHFRSTKNATGFFAPMTSTLPVGSRGAESADTGKMTNSMEDAIDQRAAKDATGEDHLEAPSNLQGVFTAAIANVQSIDLGAAPSKSFPTWISAANLPSLSALTISPCNMRISDKLQQLTGLSTLRHLDLSGCPTLTTVAQLRPLARLEELRLSGCENLVEMHDFRRLKLLDVTSCPKLQKLPDLPELHTLLAVKSGLCTEKNMRSCFKGRSLDTLATSYEVPAARKLQRWIIGYISEVVPMRLGRWSLHHARWIGREVLPAYPREDSDLISYRQTSYAKQMPDTAETELVILSRDVREFFDQKHGVQGVVARCLLEDKSKFNPRFLSPLQLSLVCGENSQQLEVVDHTREISSRDSSLGCQLHVHRLSGRAVTALKCHDRVELRARYISPADVTLVHADITLFGYPPPEMEQCLDLDHVCFKSHETKHVPKPPSSLDKLDEKQPLYASSPPPLSRMSTASWH